MKKAIVSLTMSFMLVGSNARADMFGGDVAVLMQILANAIKQLAELENLLNNGKDTLRLLEDINRGINDSLGLARTINPNIDPGIYKDWHSVQEALQKIQTIYGVVTPSPEQRLYQDSDQGAAEAIQMNNDIYAYTRQIDEIGESIKSASHSVSPGGAQKLTAESLGVVLHVLTQSLRTQATGLKLQAQSIAMSNKHEKDSTRAYLDNAEIMRQAMRADKSEFKTPRF